MIYESKLTGRITGVSTPPVAQPNREHRVLAMATYLSRGDSQRDSPSRIRRRVPNPPAIMGLSVVVTTERDPCATSPTQED